MGRSSGLFQDATTDGVLGPAGGVAADCLPFAALAAGALTSLSKRASCLEASARSKKAVLRLRNSKVVDRTLQASLRLLDKSLSSSASNGPGCSSGEISSITGLSMRML